MHARLSPAASLGRVTHVVLEAATLYHDLMLQQLLQAREQRLRILMSVTETLFAQVLRWTDAAGGRHVNTPVAGERGLAARRRFLNAGLKDDAHASSVGGANFVRESFHAVG